MSPATAAPAATLQPAAAHPGAVQWRAPAAVWGQEELGFGDVAFLQPWIAEFDTDTFLDDFLALMAGTRPGESPAALAGRTPATGAGTRASPFKLYQPLHQRYYLVSGSLVCRRVGLPDRRVQSAQGERTTFVLRRLRDGGEEARVTAGGASRWQAATATALVPGEEQLPLHPVAVAATAAPGTPMGMLGLAEDGRRTMHYGYIPVAGREARVEPIADPVKALSELAPIPGQPYEDPRLDELMIRVTDPWKAIADATGKANVDVRSPSLYVLLDLGAWLRDNLPALWNALPSGAGLTGALLTLFDFLNHPDRNVTATPGGPTALPQVLFSLRNFLPLVTGEPITPPTTTYVLPGAVPAAAGVLTAQLLTNARNALAQAGTAMRVPAELDGLIVDDTPAPGSTLPAPSGDVYVIRLVYEHAPCRPVLSEASRPMVFARALENGAPARKIRIPLPDISNMRGFKRGVAFEMPPSLRQALSRVTKKTLDEDVLPDPGLQLGMICSFSLQIIMLVAFVVMFIFLFLLNIVFWWLAFLKICFPIPKKK